MTGAAVVRTGATYVGAGALVWVARKVVADEEGAAEDAEAEGAAETEALGDAEALAGAPLSLGAGELAATGADRVNSVAKATVANALS